MSDSNLNKTVDARNAQYGDFYSHAGVTQALKKIMYVHPKWCQLEVDQKEALEMIVHKIGRILNGDPNYADSWHDVSGYAKLVEDRLNGKRR